MAGDFIARRYGGRNIAIANDGTVYGQGLAAQVRRRLRQLGVSESLYTAYQPGAEDYSALVSTLRSADIDVLYVAGYGPDAALMVRTAREQGDDLQLIGGDGLAMEEFWSVAGAAGEGTIFSARRSIHPDSDAAGIRASFRLRGLGPGSTGVGAYAAVEVWARAVERAGTFKLAAVADQLRHGRFRTILGDVTFDARGDLRGAAWEMQVWRNGDHGPIDLSTTAPSN
jgi:branched-chain amino acid transport system substrate-binding protein